MGRNLKRKRSAGDLAVAKRKYTKGTMANYLDAEEREEIYYKTNMAASGTP